MWFYCLQIICNAFRMQPWRKLQKQTAYYVLLINFQKIWIIRRVANTNKISFLKNEFLKNTLYLWFHIRVSNIYQVIIHCKTKKRGKSKQENTSRVEYCACCGLACTSIRYLLFHYLGVGMVLYSSIWC